MLERGLEQRVSESGDDSADGTSILGMNLQFDTVRPDTERSRHLPPSERTMSHAIWSTCTWVVLILQSERLRWGEG